MKTPMILYGVKNLDFVVGTSTRGKESLHSYSLLIMGWTLVKLKQHSFTAYGANDFSDVGPQKSPTLPS
jgi:hypothetical protein